MFGNLVDHLKGRKLKEQGARGQKRWLDAFHEQALGILNSIDEFFVVCEQEEQHSSYHFLIQMMSNL